MDELNRVIADIMSSSGNEDKERPENPAAEPQQGENALPAGLLGLIGGFSPPPTQRMELLLALKPHMGAERQAKLDRIYSLMRTAYMIRGALSALGGLSNV